MSSRLKAIVGAGLATCGVAIALISQSGVGFIVGLVLMFGGGALFVREQARLDDRLPWWKVFFYGPQEGQQPGPEILIGPGGSVEDDDPDRDQVRRDRSD